VLQEEEHMLEEALNDLPQDNEMLNLQENIQQLQNNLEENLD